MGIGQKVEVGIEENIDMIPFVAGEEVNVDHYMQRVRDNNTSKSAQLWDNEMGLFSRKIASGWTIGHNKKK